MTMGERIRQTRKAKGFTMEYVAERLDVSRQAVHKWEKDLSRPDTDNLIALSALFDTPVDYFTGGKRIDNHKNIAEKYFEACVLPLLLMPICWLLGVLSGVYTDMVQIPIGNGLRVGIPFMMYGSSPLAIILAVLSVICFVFFITLLFLGHQANKD